MHSLCRWLIAAAVAVLFVPSVVHAQASGEIFGRISDSSGAVMPGVTVTLSGPSLITPQSTVSLESGAVIDSLLRPSSDTPTHLELYRAFPQCGGIVHTHSELATALAQARLPIRCMGTTHADYFRGDVPVTRPMTREEVEGDYERETGLVIVEAFRSAGVSAEEVPAVLVANHGPFAWGPDPFKAIENARVLEFLARLECIGQSLAPHAPRPAPYLIDKHYLRKHGAGAYYGQK